MTKEIEPKDTTRAAAYALWMKAPNPMVSFFKTLDVTNLVRLCKRRHLKFNMLLDYCIGRAAAPIEEFYLLPVGDRLMRYDALSVNTIVKNRAGGGCRHRTAAGPCETGGKAIRRDGRDRRGADR